ncbi:tetratricopeptide repeat protein [Pseudoalteromonas byunsanensis]|uniref:tetratricopeptide repeat protein n=1 Tax=Pseudoalteromonas byunsanensis TaxID=327939 RepID=UPI001FE20705|nr:tetratricopeptide repeat protein [Pseudoalteromonas byunsanensis]
MTCKRVIQTLPPKGISAFKASLELVELYRKAGDLKLANQVLDTLLEQDLKSPQKYSVIRQKGINAYRQRNYIQALEYFHEAQLIAEQQDDLRLIGKSANDLANVYQALGDLDTALTLFLRSYQLAKQLNDTHRQAITLNNLGNVSRDINQLDDAILSFRQAHVLHQQAGDITKANHSLLSLGEVFLKKRQLEKAQTLIHDLVAPLNESGAHAQVSRAYLLLAEIAIAQNNTEQAAHWLNAQKRTRQLIQSSNIDQRALLIEAKLKQLEGEHDAAQVILKQGLSAHNQQNSQLTELFYIALIQSQQQTERYRDAIDTLQNYNNMLKSSRSQSESLYQFRLKKANVFNTTTASQNHYWFIAFVCFAFFGGVLITVVYFKSKTVKLSFSGDGEVASNENIAHLDDYQSRVLMVEIMTLALNIWEHSSGRTRIELAEQSKVWKVNIDDGRLRVRTFERYLSTKTLPKKPRWRNIISTANHVIEQCDTDYPQLKELQNKVSKLEKIALNCG